MPSVEIIEAKTVSLARLISLAREHNFKVNKIYQRGKVWKMKNRKKLIESILKGYCIGLFTFKQIEDNRWEILDGQQRLDTIFIFMGEELNENLGNPDKKFYLNNLSYEDIISDDDIRPVFEGCKICYVLLPSTMNDVETAKYFVALQEGLPLIPAERLNAKHGFVRNLIVKESDRLPLLSNRSFIKEERFSRRYLLAQLLQIELNTRWGDPPNISGFRAEDLYEMYDNYASPNQTGKSMIRRKLRKISNALNILQITMLGDEVFLKHVGYFIPIYLLTRYLAENRYAYDLNKYHDMITRFRVRINKARKGTKSKSSIFKALISGGTTEVSLKQRHRLLKEEFDKVFGSRPVQRDSRRFFSHAMKLEIYNRDVGQCYFRKNDFCPKTRIRFTDENKSFHHIKFYNVGGPTIARNGALCHVECHQNFHDLPNNKDTDLYES